MANIPLTQPNAGRRARAATRAVLLDALGTLVALEDPWVRLRETFPEVPEEEMVAAVRAEMSYYRSHCAEGRDPGSLAELRERCAALISERIGREVGVEVLLGAIRFSAYPDAPPAIGALRRRGIACVCVSNWDISLHRVLERCGLAALLDGAVCSAEAGVSKPDPAIFEAALGIAGCSPREALVVGDTPDTDIAGAAAAGIPALLIDRDGGGDISSLREVAGLV
ncbi:MAG: HAD-IA family hydrolase [Solirubrobacterales bacterium]